MIWDTTQQAKVYVVDADQTGYGELLRDSAARNTQIVFFKSGRDALRINPYDGPTVWIVNMDLPDMSGTDLRTMLRNRGNQSPLALVGDEYRPEDEIAARCAGAEMYFVKSMIHEVLKATV